jgi:hypothetical protein
LELRESVLLCFLLIGDAQLLAILFRSLVVGHMEILGIDDRDREARMVVRTKGRVFEGLIE